MKALTIIRKYPPPMIRRTEINNNYIISKMEQITKPQKVKETESKYIKFCPIWIRKFF